MNPLEYCKQKVAQSGSSFTVSFLFLPKEKRHAMTALYAFCREVDDVVDECTDYNVAQIKLNWWKCEIEKCFEQKPQHPVSHALQPFITTFKLEKAHFLAIIDGMEMDLKFNRYEDFEQLALYCYRVASVVGLLTANILGYKNAKTLLYASDLGMAFQLTNIIRDVGEDARRGRIYLPLNELKAADVTEADILQSRESGQVKVLMEKQIQRAQTYYDSALKHLPIEDANTQRAGLMMAAIYRALLNEIKQSSAEKVLNHKTSIPPFRKIWLATRTYIKYA